MSESTDVTRALKRVPLPTFAYHSLGQKPKYDDSFYAEQEAALSAAGLIVTDLHERALAACEGMCRVSLSDGLLPESSRCLAIGRESLAPKEPAGWYADSTCVRYRPAQPKIGAIVCPDFATADKVAKALNAEGK